jgi:hypothetical protein
MSDIVAEIRTQGGASAILDAVARQAAERKARSLFRLLKKHEADAEVAVWLRAIRMRLGMRPTKDEIKERTRLRVARFRERAKAKRR